MISQHKAVGKHLVRNILLRPCEDIVELGPRGRLADLFHLVAHVARHIEKRKSKHRSPVHLYTFVALHHPQTNTTGWKANLYYSTLSFHDNAVLTHSHEVDTAVLVLDHTLVLVHSDPTTVNLVCYVHALGMNSLHLDTELRFGLVLLDAQLLEEDVRAVEDGTRIAGGGALAAEEGGELAGLDTALLGETVAYGAAKGGLGDVGFLEEGTDLFANLVARLVDSDGLGVFALETDAAGVEDLGDLLVDAPARAGLGLFGGQGLETLELALLEELEGGGVGVAVHALIGAGHGHEVLVAPGGDADVLLELLDFHVTAVDEVADLRADLLAALVDMVQTGVIVGDFGDVLGLFQLLDGVGLALSAVGGGRGNDIVGSGDGLRIWGLLGGLLRLLRRLRMDRLLVLVLMLLLSMLMLRRVVGRVMRLWLVRLGHGLL